MSLEENKAIVRKVTEAENKKDLAELDELISPYYFDQTLQLRGPEGYKQFLTMLFKGFPDWYETIEDLIAEGDKVCIRLKIDTGTHTGEFRGLAPTGKKTTFMAIQIWRIVDGKVVEKESVYNFLDFFKQLGVIEYKGFPDEKSNNCIKG